MSEWFISFYIYPIEANGFLFILEIRLGGAPPMPAALFPRITLNTTLLARHAPQILARTPIGLIMLVCSSLCLSINILRYIRGYEHHIITSVSS